MITSNYTLTRVHIYKAIKEYKGDNLVDDLTWCLYKNDIKLLNNNSSPLSLKDYINDLCLTPFGEEIMEKYKQQALNHLRCFKTLRLKNKSKNK